MDSNAAAGSLIGLMMVSSKFEDDAAREKKRRFSEAQVKSMEVMFEAQAKLEPRKKHKLAKDLGLQPRQVAIWFQNKRARWKSKELERAYAALSADYDALRSSFDSLLHQKNVLSIQVQRLEEMLEINAHERQDLTLSSYTKNLDEENKLKIPLEGEEIEHHLHKSKEMWGNRSLISDDSEQQQFCFHNTSCTFDHQLTGSGCSQWWDFLPYE